jgi:uncharacterized membrane protein YeaQ/YmgE (transglycosylase-associated protein family)
MPILVVLLIAIVVLVVLGWAVVGVAFALLWWALIGLLIGALGRLILPGRQPIGLVATAASGVAASLLGGVVARAADLGGVLQFVIAVLVAAVLVAAFCTWQRRDEGSDPFHWPHAPGRRF